MRYYRRTCLSAPVHIHVLQRGRGRETWRTSLPCTFPTAAALLTHCTTPMHNSGPRKRTASATRTAVGVAWPPMTLCSRHVRGTSWRPVAAPHQDKCSPEAERILCTTGLRRKTHRCRGLHFHRAGILRKMCCQGTLAAGKHKKMFCKGSVGRLKHFIYTQMMLC